MSCEPAPAGCCYARRVLSTNAKALKTDVATVQRVLLPAPTTDDDEFDESE
jgi:hypothetical protein